MIEPNGYIEVTLFDEEVDGPEHPVALSFRDLLVQVAEEYQCRLVFFDVKQGTVSFSFDSDELTAEIIKILQQKNDDESES